MGVLFLWGVFFFSGFVAQCVFSYEILTLPTFGTWRYCRNLWDRTISVTVCQQTGISWVTVVRICREQKTCPYGICFICSDCRITFLKFLLWFWTEMWKWPWLFLWGIYEKLENLEDRRKKEYMAMWAWICHPYELQWENYQYFKKIWGLGRALPS